MVKITGWCKRILASLGQCWFIEVLDKAGSTVLNCRGNTKGLKYCRMFSNISFSTNYSINSFSVEFHYCIMNPRGH